MKKLVALLLALLVAIPSFAMADGGVVNVFNWEDYISDEVIRQFEEETGIKVNYSCFTTNEDMILKVETTPGAFDLCFPSDYIVERMMRKDLLAEIDYANVPNMQYILDSLKDPSYDAGNAHSVPYMWGTTGILYNKTMVEEPITSWADLWDERYKGQVIMLDSIRNTMGLTLKMMGSTMSTTDIVALEAAKEKLIEQKRNGIVKTYQVDLTKDMMISGEAAIAVMWTGDAQYAISFNPNLAYVIPSEGSNVWVDCMVIPKGAANKENAEKFINFLCRPDIAQKNCEYITYSSPNAGAIELMGESYSGNTVMNPSEEEIARCETIHDLDEAYLAIYSALWNDVKNAK